MAPSKLAENATHSCLLIRRHQFKAAPAIDNLQAGLSFVKNTK
jgi:hypothetical protein